MVVAACFPLAVCFGAQRTAALEHTALPIGTTVTKAATVLELPRTDRGGRSAVVIHVDGERVLLRPLPWKPVLPAVVGAHIAVTGELREPDLVASAGHAHATLLAQAVKVLPTRRGGPMGFVDTIRTKSQHALSDGLPPPESGLFRGMVLGEDAALPQDVRDEMRASGLSHLVAASGANVALLATLALFAGALAGVPIRARLVLVLGLIALYVPLAGGGPSIQRAGVMGIVGVVALLESRPSDRWYALLLAAAATLALDPRSIADPGWQMSFAAVIALLGGARAFAARVPGPRPVAEATAVTVLATLATAPIGAAHFGTASLASLPANVLAAPAVAPIMWLGLLAALGGQLSTELAQPFTALASPLLGYLVWLGEHAARWPGAGMKAAWPLVTGVAAATLIAIWLWCRGAIRPEHARRVAPIAAVIFVALAALLLATRANAPAPPPEGVLRVTALDVGQGDAILVQSGAASVLFDAGLPQAPTVRRLREAGVRRLDAFIVTHPDADHAGGAPAVLKETPVALLVDGSGRLAARGATRRIVPRAGQEIDIGSLKLSLLWPTAEAAETPGAATNDLSAVVLARAGNRKALLAGDAESDVLSGLDLPDVDILKVSHHGSADEGLAELLQRLRPEAALISVGRRNDYGHPTASTLAALRGIDVHRTDTEGSVSIEASPRGLSSFAFN